MNNTTSTFEVQVLPFRAGMITIGLFGIVGNGAIITATVNRGTTLTSKSNLIIAFLALNDLSSNFGGILV